MPVKEHSVNWIQYGHSYALDSTPALHNLDYTEKSVPALTRMGYIFITARRGANKTAPFKPVLRLLRTLG